MNRLSSNLLTPKLEIRLVCQGLDEALFFHRRLKYKVADCNIFTHIGFAVLANCFCSLVSADLIIEESCYAVRHLFVIRVY